MISYRAARHAALVVWRIRAPVAKWLTRWSAKPVFMGSNPIRCSNYLNSLESDSVTAEQDTVAENVASAALFCVPCPALLNAINFAT
jgi:hypothetical protein